MTGRHPRDENVLTCDDVIARMYELLDEELAAAVDATMQAHLAHCTHCARVLTYQRAFLRCLARADSAKRAPNALRIRIIQAIRGEITHGPA